MAETANPPIGDGWGGGNPSAMPPVWVLGGLIASSVTGLLLILPAMPGMKAAFGLSATDTQLLLSIYLLSLAAGQLALGVVSDIVGRRPVLLAGVGCFLVATTALFFADTGLQLICLRAVQGFGAAACMAMGRAIINDCFPRIEAARVTSTVTAAMGVVPTLAIAAGGLVIEVAGFQGALGLMLALGLFNLGTCLAYVRETHPPVAGAAVFRKVVSAYRDTLAVREFRRFATITAMQACAFFSLQGFLPFKFESIGQSALQFGFWFALGSIGYVFGNLVSRRYTRRVGLERIVLFGSVVGTAAMAAMAGLDLVDFRHPLGYALCMFVFGMGNGVVVANALVGAVSAVRNRGTATGMVGAAQVASGALLGWFIALIGGNSVFWIAMACVHVPLVVSFLPASRLYLAARGTQAS